MSEVQLIALCACGRVVFEARGAPITSVICYCDSCQRGGRQIEALPGAPPVLEPDGGSAYVVYRRDRVRCVAGDDLLRPMKIDGSSATKRVVANCCNSAMVLAFDDDKHWVDVYRNRLAPDPPAADMQICRARAPRGYEPSDGVPAYRGYPLRFLGKLLLARAAMALGR